jgi:hypothetical protein
MTPVSRDDPLKTEILAFAAAILSSALMAGPAAADHGVKRGDGGGANRCRNANDLAKCEARNAALSAAEESCKDRTGAEKRTCVEDAVCSKAKDPERCRKRVAKHIEN